MKNCRSQKFHPLPPKELYVPSQHQYRTWKQNVRFGSKVAIIKHWKSYLSKVFFTRHFVPYHKKKEAVVSTSAYLFITSSVKLPWNSSRLRWWLQKYPKRQASRLCFIPYVHQGNQLKSWRSQIRFPSWPMFNLHDVTTTVFLLFFPLSFLFLLFFFSSFSNTFRLLINLFPYLFIIKFSPLIHNTYDSTCVRACVHTCVRAFMHVHTQARTHASIHACKHARMQ